MEKKLTKFHKISQDFRFLVFWLVETEDQMTPEWDLERFRLVAWHCCVIITEMTTPMNKAICFLVVHLNNKVGLQAHQNQWQFLLYSALKFLKTLHTDLSVKKQII